MCVCVWVRTIWRVMYMTRSVSFLSYASTLVVDNQTNARQTKWPLVQPVQSSGIINTHFLDSACVCISVCCWEIIPYVIYFSVGDAIIFLFTTHTHTQPGTFSLCVFERGCNYYWTPSAVDRQPNLRLVKSIQFWNQKKEMTCRGIRIWQFCLYYNHHLCI